MKEKRKGFILNLCLIPFCAILHNMKECVVRIRIPEHLHKRFKVVCAQKDLSIPKQTAELIRVFVQVQEENNERLFMGKLATKKD